jgi:hypothetical protein
MPRSLTVAIKVKDYLAGIAPSRALYRTLFEHAKGLLPPADANRAEPEPLTVAWTLRQMADEMDVSVSTLRVDLLRLERYGWLEWNRRPYFLGQRIGASYHLIADGMGRAQTSEERLVSREVLQLPEPQTSNTTPTPAPAASARGVNRKWTPE